MALLQWTKDFKKDYKSLPDEIKKRARKQLLLLGENPKHPSLRVKKTKGIVIKGYNDVFEGRITRDYRFLFLIKNNVFVLLRCGKHDEFF